LTLKVVSCQPKKLAGDDRLRQQSPITKAFIPRGKNLRAIWQARFNSKRRPMNVLTADALNRGDVTTTGLGSIKIDGGVSSRTMNSVNINGTVSTGCVGNFTARKNGNLAQA
jgi:hypothetical protein